VDVKPSAMAPGQSASYPSLSVVIANYNYARFVSAAIDSALNLAWPAVEVIVVDDGSTDSSRAVIESYGHRITAIFQSNAGQKEACNVGFSRSHGDVIMFLDADDVLDERLMLELARCWHPGISKVQFQMRIIDAEGRPTGAVLPQFGSGAPTPQQIRRWAQRAAAYPTPPGSGNAYARGFLEQIFPLTGSERFSDSYCLAAAPYFGEVVTISKPLVSYRVHGSNDGAMAAMDVTRLGTEVVRAQWRFRYAQRMARLTGISVEDEVFHRGLPVLCYRLASARLAPAQHPIEDDTVAIVLRHFVRAFLVEQGLSLRSRSTLLTWAALVALAPDTLAHRLVSWRFAPATRPRVLSGALRSLGVLRRAATPPAGGVDTQRTARAT
jgi:glycosyltransferase involved in cell wall biosynthesis